MEVQATEALPLGGGIEPWLGGTTLAERACPAWRTWGSRDRCWVTPRRGWQGQSRVSSAQQWSRLFPGQAIQTPLRRTVTFATRSLTWVRVCPLHTRETKAGLAPLHLLLGGSSPTFSPSFWGHSGCPRNLCADGGGWMKVGRHLGDLVLSAQVFTMGCWGGHPETCA